MVENYKAEDRAGIFASGTSEEYGDLEKLLQQVVQIIDDQELLNKKTEEAKSQEAAQVEKIRTDAQTLHRRKRVATDVPEADEPPLESPRQQLPSTADTSSNQPVRSNTPSGRKRLEFVTQSYFESKMAAGAERARYEQERWKEEYALRMRELELKDRALQLQMAQHELRVQEMQEQRDQYLQQQQSMLTQQQQFQTLVLAALGKKQR